MQSEKAKLVLSPPCKCKGEVEVQLHSFVFLTVDKCD
jgi:hypothetical protein